MDGLVPSYRSAPLIGWSDFLFTVHYWKFTQNPSLILKWSGIHLSCLPSIINLGIRLFFCYPETFWTFKYIYLFTHFFSCCYWNCGSRWHQAGEELWLNGLPTVCAKKFLMQRKFYLFFLNPTNLWLPGAGNYSRVCSASRSDKMFAGLSLNTAKATLHPELPASNYSPCYCVWQKKKKNLVYSSSQARDCEHILPPGQR